MMRKYLLLVLLVHVGPGRSQFSDFFPSFSIFSYTTPRTTKHTARPKPNTQSSYKNDDYIKPTSNRRDYIIDNVRDQEPKTVEEPVYYYSTEKPVRKTTKNNHGTSFNSETNTGDIDNNYKNKQTDFNEVKTLAQDTRDSERNLQDNYYNNFNNHNYKTTHNYYELTTKNPFNERPGVKPSIIDNGPPITNRPVYKTTTIRTTTRWPYIVPPRPTDSGALAFPDDDITPEVVTGPDEESMSEVDKQRYVELAEKKCDVYKSFHTKQLQAIPLLPSPEPVEVNISSCTPTNIPLIVGGKVVSVADFPHMALLGWPDLMKGGYSWKCGGSLISEQYVLTAGHCTYLERDEVTGPPRVVQLGSSFLDDPGALVVRVGSVIRHPKYKPNRSYYDIALLKLVNSVKFSELIRPACLGVPPHAGKHIIATGWGQTQLVGNLSLELRSVSLPVWDINSCARVLGTSRKMPAGPSKDSQMCAGEPNGGKDTCQGDSGGPAQVQEGCIWRIVAVTSIGRSCAAPNTPGLYSLVNIPFLAAQVFGGHRNNIQSNHNNNNSHGYVTQNNNQHNYETQNNNQNNYNSQHNHQSYDAQNDNGNSYNIQNNNRHSDRQNNNQHSYDTSYSTQNNNYNDYEAQNNNQTYYSNGNLRRPDKKHEYNNQQSSRNVNVNEYDRTEKNRYNSYDNNQSNRNSDRYTSEPTTNDNYYRNQQNNRTEVYYNKQQRNNDSNNRNHKTNYDNYDKPIWWT